MRISIKRQFLFLGLLTGMSNPQANTLYVGTDYDTWYSGLGGAASALKVLGGVSYSLNKKISLAGKISGGNYKTDSVSASDLSKWDGDFSVQYNLPHRISFVSGYSLSQVKYINFTDSKRSFEDISHQVGIGVSTYYQVRNNLFLSSLVKTKLIYAESTNNIGTVDRGTGFAYGIEGRVTYLLDKELTVSSALTIDESQIDYGGEAGSWVHNRIGWIISIAHRY